MYECLANFIIGMPRANLADLYLEDVALCATWYESHQDNEELRARYDELRQIFDIWVNEVRPPRSDTMGYRQQPLLRQLIKELAEGQASQLERDELDLLYYAAGLARRSGKLDIFRRTLSCIAPYSKSVEYARKQKAVSPGCPALGKRLAVITDEELKSAELRDVRTFGGLSLPIRGPVYLREGNLRVMSDIPADCTVVVDGGSCYVRGSVSGNVAATYGCEVLDNIGGVVVARRGNVCARDIINRATVISKESKIQAMSAECPRLLFAAKEINIRGDAVQGRYMARRIVAGGDVVGGDLYATEWVEAANFVHTDDRRLRVCLLRGLSCQDYGEVLSLEAGKLLNQAMKLRQRLGGLEELIEITEREADDMAGNILMYILGEEDTQDKIHHIQNKRRRQSFLDRLTAGVRSVMAAAEDRINLMHLASNELADAASGSAEEQATLDDLRRELGYLSNEGSIDMELQKDKEDVLYLGRKLQRKGLSVQGVEQVLARLTEKSVEIEEKNSALRAIIAREEGEIEKTMVRAALLDRAKEERSRAEMLKQLLSAAKKRPNMEIFRQRANDRYIKLLQRTVENRNSRMAGYIMACKDVEERIEQVRQRLWSEYMVSLPDHVLRGWAVGGARIRGCFSPGIVICSWRHLLEDEPGAARSRIFTQALENNLPAIQTFIRTDRSTIEPVGPPQPLPDQISINV